MDKIKINNQIVLMRKFVKQAKTRFINKYVKEHRRLQDRKGDENQVSKSKRKAERLLLEINILKKINPDSVSKMALSKAKDWKAVLNQKNIPLEDRCFANLANFKPVKAEVEKFYSANNYLVPRIKILLQEWEEKAKLTPQSAQKNKKPLKNDKAYEKLGKESDVFQIKAKPEIGNAQPKKFQPIVKKPLESENHELSNVDNNISDSSSDDDDDDEKVEENEHLSDNNNLNVINTQKELKKSKVGSENIESNLNPRETDSPSSELDEDESVSQGSGDEDESVSQGSEDEDESVSQGSEDEDESVSQGSEDKEPEDRIPPKNFEDVKNTITSQKSELKVNSVKNNPKLPKIPLETNKIADKQPTFQKKLSPKDNSTKAVALLNLNEMLDMDEIPVDNNRTVAETVEETAKRKKDTFFLSGDGDDFSESGDGEDSDNGRQNTNLSPLRKKPRNAFNKRGSFNEGGVKREDNFKNRRNFGNSPYSQKFGFREKKFHNNNKEFNSNKQSSKFERNQGRPENNFNKSRFNNFEKEFNSSKQSSKFERNQGRPENNFNKSRFNNLEKNDKRQENQFNKNKNWNTKDTNNRTEGKSFRTSGKFFEKNTSFNKNDNSSYKREGFSQPGKKEEPPLHPSWEAKRKLKTTAKAKFQGKRVVFDD